MTREELNDRLSRLLIDGLNGPGGIKLPDVQDELLAALVNIFGLRCVEMINQGLEFMDVDTYQRQLTGRFHEKMTEELYDVLSRSGVKRGEFH